MPAEYWPVLDQEDDLLVEPVAAETRCLGGFGLELTLDHGRVVRSIPPDLWSATSDDWDGGRRATPALRHVGATEPLRVRLRS